MSRKHITDFRGEMVYTPNGRPFKIKDELVSPTDEGFLESGDYSFENFNCKMRKSLSVGDLSTLKQDTYRRSRKQSCTPEPSKTKFVSIAESIYRFQRDTPDRFHTWKRSTFVGQASFVPHGLTRPQSPKLRCKDRARSHHILSQKEKEELELEEIRKSKIKANPIPKSVIEGPKNLPEIQRKPITVPEPFQLTEVIKKPPPSPEYVYNFKARPAPKHILEKPKVDPIKSPAPVTKAVSPKFHCKKTKPVDCLKSNLKKNENQPNKSEKHIKPQKHHGPVKPEPFSFEKRDEELKRKHEENIKRQLEEERKLASQFKAQPLPAGVKKRMQIITNRTAASSNSSENKENCVKFEAKPPVVLYKKPFKPVLQTTQTMAKPFDLATEKRATEREQFDKLLKEKEEENKKYIQQREKEQREAEEKALQELRAKLVHHAKPIPPLVPNLPEKLNIPLTIPETPKFVRRLKNKKVC